MKNNCIIAILFLIAAAGNSVFAQKRIRGSSNYLLGVNYPWQSYGTDFGQNAWGANGISKHVDGVSSDYNKFRDSAIKVVRWWLFADGRAGIITTSDDTPTGVDSVFYQDLDAAIKIARDRGVRFNMVLFDFLLVQIGKTEGGVKMGSRKEWLTTKLDALIQNVIIPVLKRYGNEPTIYSWEIMNEPEWIISDIKYPSIKDESVTQSQFFTFAKKISDAVKANTKQYLTLGCSSLKWHRIWTPVYAKEKGLPALNLDYYQVHYYSWMDGRSISYQ